MATTTRSERIKTAREEKGWTLEQLGKKCGVAKATVSKWEAHKSGTPDIELHVFFKLAKALELDARELATGDPPDDNAVAPNMRSLIEDYSAIDPTIRRPVRTLIGQLAEQARNMKPAPRKARDKSKPREPVLLEIR